MSDEQSANLQNLLIQKLLDQKSDSSIDSTEPSSFGTIGIIALVTILIIVAGIIVYYVIFNNNIPAYPLSPFKYGQTVVIRPAILSEVGGDLEKQYLRQDLTSPCYRNDYSCASGFTMGTNACAAKFTGDKSDPSSQWVLMQKSNPYGYDANQSLLYGLGNRFYLQNKNTDDLTDPKARLRYQLLNESGFGMCYNTTPAVIGSPGNETLCNWFETNLLIYFMPTNYKDLYYLLLPSCSTDVGANDTTTEPNDGIISVRPWSPNNASNQKAGVARCYQCDNPGNYTPYNNNQLNDNIMLVNYLPPENRLPPYPNPNTHLFKVTLANQ